MTHAGVGVGVARVLATLALAGCGQAEASTCPEVRTLYDGQCCAAWSVADLDVCVVSTWDTPAREEAIEFSVGARDPEIALDDDSRVVVTWVQPQDAGTRVLIAEQTDDETFVVRSPGEALPGNGSSPSLTTDATGRALLAWRQHEGDAGTVHYTERNADGNWDTNPEPADVPLSFPPNAYEPRVAYGDDGETLIVYNQWTGTNFGVAIASRAAGDDGPIKGPGSGQDVVSPPVLFSNAPIPAVASNGDAIITWYQSPDTDLMTFVSERFGVDGEFSTPAADAFISAPGGAVDSHAEANPSPAIHDRGSAVVAWTQDNAQGHSPVYLASRDGWGEWTTPAGLDDSFSVPNGAARCVQTAFGGDGSLLVTWFEEDPSQRFSVHAAYRAPDGEWIDGPREAVQLSADGADGIHPAVAVGDEGQALVAFAERSGDRWDLVVRRRNPGGSAWIAPEVLSADLAGDASEPTVAYNGNAFVVAWVHGPPLEGQLHVARVEPLPVP